MSSKIRLELSRECGIGHQRGTLVVQRGEWSRMACPRGCETTARQPLKGVAKNFVFLRQVVMLFRHIDDSAPNGRVDAAARIHESFAGSMMMRNTFPPLASNDLFGFA